MIKGHCLFWVVALALEALLMVWLSTPANVQRSLQREMEDAQRWLGGSTVREAVSTADRLFIAVLGDREANQAFQSRFFVDRHTQDQSADLVGHWLKVLTGQSNRLIAALVFEAYRVVYRVGMWSTWTLPIVLLIAGGLVHGLVERRLKGFRFGYTNPVVYNLTSHALILIVFAPLALLLSPVFVAWWTYPSWGIVMAVLTAVAAANLQSIR